MARPMQNFVMHENIEAFRRQLAQEASVERRETLTRLLAEEEAKLAAVSLMNLPSPPGVDACS
jgi:hypothetical protein